MVRLWPVGGGTATSAEHAENPAVRIGLRSSRREHLSRDLAADDERRHHGAVRRLWRRARHGSRAAQLLAPRTSPVLGSRRTGILAAVPPRPAMTTTQPSHDGRVVETDVLARPPRVTGSIARKQRGRGAAAWENHDTDAATTAPACRAAWAWVRARCSSAAERRRRPVASSISSSRVWHQVRCLEQIAAAGYWLREREQNPVRWCSSFHCGY